jgi:hypothetical protein
VSVIPSPAALPGRGQAARAARWRAHGLRPQFRLQPGRDDALIEWLASLGPQERSRAIRQALSEHLAARQGAARKRLGEDPELAAALDAVF